MSVKFTREVSILETDEVESLRGGSGGDLGSDDPTLVSRNVPNTGGNWDSGALPSGSRADHVGSPGSPVTDRQGPNGEPGSRGSIGAPKSSTSNLPRGVSGSQASVRTAETARSIPGQAETGRMGRMGRMGGYTPGNNSARSIGTAGTIPGQLESGRQGRMGGYTPTLTARRNISTARTDVSSKRTTGGGTGDTSTQARCKQYLLQTGVGPLLEGCIADLMKMENLPSNPYPFIFHRARAKEIGSVLSGKAASSIPSPLFPTLSSERVPDIHCSQGTGQPVWGLPHTVALVHPTSVSVIEDICRQVAPGSLNEVGPGKRTRLVPAVSISCLTHPNVGTGSGRLHVFLGALVEAADTSTALELFVDEIVERQFKTFELRDVIYLGFSIEGDDASRTTHFTGVHISTKRASFHSSVLNGAKRSRRMWVDLAYRLPNATGENSSRTPEYKLIRVHPLLWTLQPNDRPNPTLATPYEILYQSVCFSEGDAVFLFKLDSVRGPPLTSSVLGDFRRNLQRRLAQAQHDGQFGDVFSDAMLYKVLTETQRLKERDFLFEFARVASSAIPGLAEIANVNAALIAALKGNVTSRVKAHLEQLFQYLIALITDIFEAGQGTISEFHFLEKPVMSQLVALRAGPSKRFRAERAAIPALMFVQAALSGTLVSYAMSFVRSCPQTRKIIQTAAGARNLPLLADHPTPEVKGINVEERAEVNKSQSRVPAHLAKAAVHLEWLVEVGIHEWVQGVLLDVLDNPVRRHIWPTLVQEVRRQALRTALFDTPASTVTASVLNKPISYTPSKKTPHRIYYHPGKAGKPVLFGSYSALIMVDTAHILDLWGQYAQLSCVDTVPKGADTGIEVRQAFSFTGYQTWATTASSPHASMAFFEDIVLVGSDPRKAATVFINVVVDWVITVHDNSPHIVFGLFLGEEAVISMLEIRTRHQRAIAALTTALEAGVAITARGMVYHKKENTYKPFEKSFGVHFESVRTKDVKTYSPERSDRTVYDRIFVSAEETFLAFKLRVGFTGAYRDLQRCQVRRSRREGETKALAQALHTANYLDAMRIALGGMRVGQEFTGLDSVVRILKSPAHIYDSTRAELTAIMMVVERASDLKGKAHMDIVKDQLELIFETLASHCRSYASIFLPGIYGLVIRYRNEALDSYPAAKTIEPIQKSIALLQALSLGIGTVLYDLCGDTMAWIRRVFPDIDEVLLHTKAQPGSGPIQLGLWGSSLATSRTNLSTNRSVGSMGSAVGITSRTGEISAESARLSVRSITSVHSS